MANVEMAVKFKVLEVVVVESWLLVMILQILCL